MCIYLKACQTGDWSAPSEEWIAPPWPWWDDDPAVLARNLERLGENRPPGDMAALVGHEDERVRKLAVATLRKRGSAGDLAAAVGWLDDPRHWACESVRELLARVDLDRLDEVADHIFQYIASSPAQREWAAGHLEGREEKSERRQPPLPPAHPLARAAALTMEQARELVSDPARESSWHVLGAAARMCKVPLWKLAPEPAWAPSVRAGSASDGSSQTVACASGSDGSFRPLGPERLLVSPIGISGHYGLPVEGFTTAVEAGVNLLFWEPNYHTLTAFASRLGETKRDALHFVAGTFEATPAKVRKDVDRALRLLRIDQLRIFLLFWTRSHARLTDNLLRLLDDLRAEGKAQMTGLSTHNRALAVEALTAGWDPVMVRHSAGHRGAELTVFPLAARLNRGLITFNSLCYGRLLQPRGDRPAPTAADCYRYTLSQPGVATCLSAPATMAQLEENLAVLRDPHLPEERKTALLDHGDDLYREEALFRRVVRSR